MVDEAQQLPTPKLKGGRKGLAILFVAGLAAAVIGYIALRPPDIYHTKERRAAKATMIAAITADLAAKAPPAAPSDGDWMSERVIFCADGAWLAYRSQCHKQDPKVYDLFIAKASDGKWYYSTFHFCIGAFVLASDEQAESLTEFRERYALVEFDGRSDVALERTWPPRNP